MLGHDRVWCPQWWRHAEAVARLEALWRAWEHLRQDAATGLSVWFRDHADHHMTILLDADGPFKGCDGRTPSIPSTSCRTTRRPRGMFEPEESLEPPSTPARAQPRPTPARTAGQAREHTIRHGAMSRSCAPSARSAGARRGAGARRAADDPAAARPRVRLRLRRHADRPGPGERARHAAELPADLRRRRQQFGLGSDGWAYLAALNYAESHVRDRQRARHRRAVGSELRPARPARCRSGSAAPRPTTGDTDRRTDPAEPARRHAATERLQRDRRRLRRRDPAQDAWGRPGTGRPRSSRWNNYPPEIAQVTQLVAQYTNTGQGQGGAPAATTSTTRRCRRAGRGAFR